MAPVAGVPFLELLLQMLRVEGIQEVVLGTGHMAEQIERHFGNGRGLDLSIRYSREDEPMGTGGALKLAEGLLSDPVVVLNGDSYVEWKLGSLLKLFDEKDAALVMVLQAVADVSRYGSVTIDSDGRVIEFVEKGRRAGAGLINAGVYLLRKEIVAGLPPGKAVSLEKDVFPELLERQSLRFRVGRALYRHWNTGRFGARADLARPPSSGGRWRKGRSESRSLTLHRMAISRPVSVR